MRKFDPLDEPTADKSALKCFDYAYLTEMTRLGSQSIVRVEEMSKKELWNNTFKTSEGFTLGKGDRLLYIELLKRGLIGLRPGPHECDIFEPGYIFFTQIRAGGALRVVWRVVSRRCGFGELNQFRAVKKQTFATPRISGFVWTGPKAHSRDGRQPAVPRSYRAGVHVKCEWTRQTREGEDWKERWVPLFLLSLYHFSSRLVVVPSPA